MWPLHSASSLLSSRSSTRATAFAPRNVSLLIVRALQRLTGVRWLFPYLAESCDENGRNTGKLDPSVISSRY